MIALLPTYASIGAAAPALLLVARLIQGLSVGGEYGTSATYMSEVAAPGRRGFYASFQYVTLIGGQLLALLVLVALQAFLAAEEIRAWGWRVPFVIGAVAAVVALFLRRSLAETASKESMHAKEAGTITGLLPHKRAVLLVLGFTAGGSLIFYTFTTYMQKYLVNTAGMETATASEVMTAVLLVYMLLQPRSEEHTSDLQSRFGISYAVFCLKKKKNKIDEQRAGTVQGRSAPHPKQRHV